MNKLKTYTVTFEGHWPVGACAVVVAKDRGHALRLLNPLLVQQGLAEVTDLKKLKEMLTDVANARIVLNGEY